MAATQVLSLIVLKTVTRHIGKRYDAKLDERHFAFDSLHRILCLAR